jgi:hypothetical protein
MADGGLQITFGEVLGSVPGLIALAGAILGYGRLNQRVDDMQKALEGENGLVAKLNALTHNVTGVQVAVGKLDERTANTNQTLSDMNKKLDQILISSRQTH